MGIADFLVFFSVTNSPMFETLICLEIAKFSFASSPFTKIAMSRAKSLWKRVKHRLLLSILLFLVTRRRVPGGWCKLL